MESISNEGMCRCCASEGTFKDFLTSYHWMGEEEIYADMLRDCFAITLYTSDDVNNGGICEVCITQLRNACNFKRQVQQTEEQFKKRVQNSGLKSNVIKLEMAGGDDGEHSDTNLSDEFSAAEFEVPIKEEKDEEKPKKRQAAKPSTSRAKKAKTEDGEPSAKRKRVVKPEPSVVKIRIKEEKKTNRIKVVAIKKLSEYQTDIQKHKANIKKILQSSNATPIRGHTDNGYGCSFCSIQYRDPGELKEHSLEHTSCLNNQNILTLVPRDLNQLCIKLDITNLTCKLCESSIYSIEDLIDHLKKIHKIQIFTEIIQQMLPFKFDSENLQCYICKNIFNKFKKLMEHMNVHYSNFMCDVCDAGFVNRRKLYYHKVAHNTGTFSCSQCPKIFSTYNKKRCHERQYHDKAMLVNKCGLCNALFKNNRQKDKHLVKEHGVSSFARKCQACDKVFVHQNALMIHMKRHHLVERPHKCTECGKGFFSTTELRAHMVKHTGQREYKCDVCLKSYARKWTLHEHMRIHMDDRRFKCEHCGQAFVQKCSWRGHMRAKHGEQV
ncbi:zinc finger protein 585A-like isoform X6 [Nymphalis io]|uniref:zinc finger protein 585A-like isoform X6 n=1 Tax=Inachis io TaxID=171585 RepID=UPI00216A6D23|nr:zinc finger protein 585A-like isoform X6 [Nymphalis io]